MQRLIRVGGVVLAVGLIAVTSARALITKKLPLSDILKENEFIAVLRVDKLDPKRPSVVFTVEEDLKGKLPYRRLPVNLTGDSEAKKLDHTAQLLKRLAPKLPIVLFCHDREPKLSDSKLIAFGYSNGTWFQLVARKRGDEPVVWAFTHCEPYLRKTFKGSTAEMRQAIVDGLSGKKAPPAVNDAEPPGLGPEVKTGSLPLTPRGAVFAVIPSFTIAGPLAILAVLFPSLFGGVLVLFRQWLAFFTVISVVSLLYCLHLWFAGSFAGAWWTTPAALWGLLTLTTFAGTVWAWQRHIRIVTGNEVIPQAPEHTERVVLYLLSGACLLVVLLCVFVFGAPPLAEAWWGLLLAFATGIWAGLLYKLYRAYVVGTRVVPTPALAVAAERTPALVGAPSTGFTASSHPPVVLPVNGAAAPPPQPVVRRPPRPALPTEAVMLWGALLVCTLLALARPGGSVAPPVDDTAGEGRPPAKLLADNTWLKVFEGRGMILSTPLVEGGRAYVSAARGALDRFGSVYCVDLATRNIVWKFDDDGDMKQGFSSPVLADGKLYVGEGFHEDKGCKLYCLDAASGKKHWEFATGSHTESTPLVHGGRVYFGAGDDGVYCVDARTGAKLWQYPEGEKAKLFHFHVDSTPAVAGKRVYIGAGIDEDTAHGDPGIACLDADTGKEIWVHATPRWMVKRGDPQRQLLSLPAWGSPVVDGKQVFFGLGNGRVTESSRTFEPTGALLCVDADTGNPVWEPFKVGDGVLSGPAVDGGRVYFGSRDGSCYCVDRQTGKLRWRRSLGSPVVATPALARCGTCGHTSTLYAVGSGGLVCCLDPFTGKVHWSHTDLQRQAPTLTSRPAVVVTHTPEGESRRLYFGAALNNLTIQVLYCLEDISPER